jgi:GAF domain-containing protein
MIEAMMTERLLAQPTFESAVHRLLRDVVALHGAEFGDVQLLAGEELLLVAQIGLAAPFIARFLRVSRDQGCACGRALRERCTVVVEDVERDPAYVEYRSDAKAAGYRSVQSTPLGTEGGTCVGVVSTLFANPHAPTKIELETLKTYSVRAAARLEELLDGASIEAKAKQMQAQLCDAFQLQA